MKTTQDTINRLKKFIASDRRSITHEQIDDLLADAEQLAELERRVEAVKAINPTWGEESLFEKVCETLDGRGEKGADHAE